MSRDIDKGFSILPSKKQNNRPKTKSFGYQILGFGGGAPTFEFLQATGGTVSYDGNFKIHSMSTGTFTVTALGTNPTYGARLEQVLIIAGGGSGGYNHGAGGGAGGMRFQNSVAVNAQAYSITAGGAAGNSNAFSQTNTRGGRGSQTGTNNGQTGGSGGGGDNGGGKSGSRFWGWIWISKSWRWRRRQRRRRRWFFWS